MHSRYHGELITQGSWVPFYRKHLFTLPLGFPTLYPATEVCLLLLLLVCSPTCTVLISYYLILRTNAQHPLFPGLQTVSVIIAFVDCLECTEPSTAPLLQDSLSLLCSPVPSPFGMDTI